METASASMDGLGHRVNFYAHSASSAVTALNDATARTERVVTVRQDDASVYPDGVENIVKNRVPVDTLARNARILASVRMERFVMRSVDIAHVNRGGGERSVIDPASKATTVSTAPRAAVVPTASPATTSRVVASVPKATLVTLAPNSVRTELSAKTALINAIVETTRCAMRYPESASVNRVILGLTVRVDVFKDGSDRIAINCAPVRMEGFAIRRVDRVFARRGILGQSVRSRVSRIDLDQRARKSATARTAVPVTA